MQQPGGSSSCNYFGLWRDSAVTLGILEALPPFLTPFCQSLVLASAAGERPAGGSRSSPAHRPLGPRRTPRLAQDVQRWVSGPVEERVWCLAEPCSCRPASWMPLTRCPSPRRHRPPHAPRHGHQRLCSDQQVQPAGPAPGAHRPQRRPGARPAQAQPGHPGAQPQAGGGAGGGGHEGAAGGRRVRACEGRECVGRRRAEGLARGLAAAFRYLLRC